MRIEKSLCDALIRLAELNQNNCLSEDVIFNYTEQEGLTLAETTRVCRQIEEAGVKIVSQAEYDAAVTEAVVEPTLLTSPIIASVEDIITAFDKLSASDQELCYSMIQEKLSKDTNESAKMKASAFFDRVNKMSLQYSYMAVLLLAFLNNCDKQGSASLAAVIDSFSNYYRKRYSMGEIAEQSDSIVSSPNFTYAEARKLIFFNPLGRSFLAEYIKLNKSNDCLEMNEQVWSGLTEDSICEIISIVKGKLDDYYIKLSID